MAKLNSRMKQHRCDQRSQSPLAPDIPERAFKRIGWSPSKAHPPLGRAR